MNYAQIVDKLIAERDELRGPVAWADKAMELSTDFGVESLRVGSSERQDIFLSNGKASWKTIELREKREAARDRLRQHLYAAPASVPPGYVLVPIKPTPKMLKASETCYERDVFGEVTAWPSDIYRAMIAAAGEKP